jgi:predicted MFS family arabinose efflux permease
VKPMAAPATIPLPSVDFSPAPESLQGLDGVNFFLAGVLAGFGPYVAVYLANQNWTQEKIGFVLSAGALAGLLSQVPGGELLDTIRSKRALVALGAATVAISAMIIEFLTKSLAHSIAGSHMWERNCFRSPASTLFHPLEPLIKVFVFNSAFLAVAFGCLARKSFIV